MTQRWNSLMDRFGPPSRTTQFRIPFNSASALASASSGSSSSSAIPVLTLLREMGFSSSNTLDHPGISADISFWNTVGPHDPFVIDPNDIPQHGLPSSSIMNLPLHLAKKSSRQEVCQICHENFEEDRFQKSLPCGHPFHMPCVDEWLSRQATCPVCRRPVKIRQ